MVHTQRKEVHHDIVHQSVHLRHLRRRHQHPPGSLVPASSMANNSKGPAAFEDHPTTSFTSRHQLKTSRAPVHSINPARLPSPNDAILGFSRHKLAFDHPINTDRRERSVGNFEYTGRDFAFATARFKSINEIKSDVQPSDEMAKPSKKPGKMAGGASLQESLHLLQSKSRRMKKVFMRPDSFKKSFVKQSSREHGEGLEVQLVNMKITKEGNEE